MTPTSTTPSLSGDELSDLKRYVLEASRKLLVENVDAPRFLPYFRSRFVLDQRECDQIKSCSRQSRYDGAEKLLDALLTKGGLGYDHFCAAIMHDRTQMFLLTALNKRLEILRDWRRKQVEIEQQNRQSQLEMQQQRHLHEQYVRERVESSHTHPMTSHAAMRYQANRVPTYIQQQRLHLDIAQQQAPPPERLARSPIPTEVEPMAASRQFPSPHVQHDHFYHQLPQDLPHQPYLQPARPVMHFTQPVQPVTQLAPPAQPVLHHAHPAQPVAQHPYQVQPVAQQVYPTQGYCTSYPPPPPNHCVPPPAPVGVAYPVAMENGPYREDFTVRHSVHVLTANTPFGAEANLDNLLPGMPPSPSSYGSTRGQASPQNHLEFEGEAFHRSEPPYLQGGNSPSGLVQGSRDIPSGEGGN